MFILSKLLSAITQPLFWLAVWWGVALVLLTLMAPWRRAALRMLWGGLAVLGLLGFEALPQALLRPLEINTQCLAQSWSVAMWASLCWGGRPNIRVFIKPEDRCLWVRRRNACQLRWAGCGSTPSCNWFFLEAKGACWPQG